VSAALGYRSFGPAERTIQCVEAMNMRRKGQVKRLDQSEAMGQAKFVKGLFGIAALQRCHSQLSLPLLGFRNAART
jgi:hypothetical protein